MTFSINKSDYVTSVSQSLKDDTLRLFNVKSPICVIPNFIDTHREKNQFTDCQRELMAEDDEKIVTHVSNFRKVKRIDDVVKIFNQIQKKVKSKLIMVGESQRCNPLKT